MSTRAPRRTFTFASAIAQKLDDLAESRGVKPGEVIRDAITIYDYIYEAQLEAKKNGSKLLVLLQRGEGPPAEIIVPPLSKDRELTPV